MSHEIPTESARIETNEHHCVPRSFLGSNCEHNISRAPVTEHDQFHRIMGFSPPDFMMRKVVLASINWHQSDGRMIPVDWYQKTLDSLFREDRQSFYYDESIRNKSEVCHEKLVQYAVHLRIHILEEQRMTADALRAIILSRYLDRETVEFSMDAMLLFKAPRPVDTITEFLTASNASGELLWTKALRPTVQKEFRVFKKSVDTEPMDVGGRERLINLLEAHNNRLLAAVNLWKPNGASTASKFSVYAQDRLPNLIKKSHDYES